MEQTEASITTDHESIDNQRSRRTLVHLTVLTAVVLPIALVPYLVARRTTNTLHRRLDEYKVTIQTLQRDLKTTMLDNALRRDEQARVRGILAEMKQDTHSVITATKQDLQRLRAEGDNRGWVQITNNDALRSDLQKILDEMQYTRTRQLAMQRELGTSLADLAAFIHEQGLTQGKDVRGIERLRLLALNLQSPSQDHESKSSPAGHPPSP